MPKIDLEAIPQNNATGYPAPFDAEVQGRWKRKLGPLFALADFGATHVVLKPGAWSSQRHWHDGEDELVVMLTGEAVLVEDQGRVSLRPGDICAWPKGSTNGHHLINESDQDCSFLAIGGPDCTGGGYSDIDMVFTAGSQYLHRDGRPYEASGV